MLLCIVTRNFSNFLRIFPHTHLVYQELVIYSLPFWDMPPWQRQFLYLQCHSWLRVATYWYKIRCSTCIGEEKADDIFSFVGGRFTWTLIEGFRLPGQKEILGPCLQRREFQTRRHQMRRDVSGVKRQKTLKTDVSVLPVSVLSAII